jgi:hypothetical protein
MSAVETDNSCSMVLTKAMVVFDGSSGNNKRDTRPEPPPNAEKASPDPKKKKVSFSSEG